MKKLSGFLAVALISSTLSYSQPSKAAVGIIMVNPSVIVGGLAMVGAGGLGLIAFDNEAAGVGGLAALLGMIVLDGEQGQSLAFKPLTAADAKTLKVSKLEKDSYNAEIDQVNFIFDEVGSELQSIKKPTAKDAKKIWERYESMVSVETFSVMQKISSKPSRK